MFKKKTYNIDIRCTNCGCKGHYYYNSYNMKCYKSFVLEFPMGTLITDDIIKSKRCSNCECLGTLIRDERKE